MDFSMLKKHLAMKRDIRDPAALAATIEKKDTGSWPSQKKKG